MKRRNSLRLRPNAGPHSVSRGAKLAPDPASPDHPPNPNSSSAPPPPSAALDLVRSAPSQPRISHSFYNRQKVRRRNPKPHRRRGAKLASDSDSSPEPVSAPDLPAPPSPRPELLRSAPPPLPPPPLPTRTAPPPLSPSRTRSSDVEKKLGGRILPTYYSRTLPHYFYIFDTSTSAAAARATQANSMAARARAEEARLRRVTAAAEEAQEAVMEDGEEVEMDDDEVPWCR